MSQEISKAKSEVKNAMLTLAFYVLFLVSFATLGNQMPGGPCSPSPFILLIPLLPIVSVILLAKNMIQRKNGKPNKISIWIHAIVLLAFAILVVQVF